MAEKNLDPTKEARSVIKYLRISPRKVRLVTQAISQKSVGQAFSVLTALNKKAARFVKEGLKSALANAKVKGLQETRLWVSEAKADGGPTMKRFMSRSMGRADQILKRSTHLTIVLKEGEKIWKENISLPGQAASQVKKEKAKKEKAGAKA